MRPVTRRDDDRDDGQPWHNRTPSLVGASIAALAVIAVLVLAATAMARQFSAPEQAPLNFVEPTYSAPATRSAAPTVTTQTVTTTSPPQTTDLSALETTSETTTETETSSAEPTVETDDEEESTETSTRRKPRTNVTRTLYPLP
ncbi:hypothetical protein ABQE93_01730 [Mycolicibacterium sp. XJ662]